MLSKPENSRQVGMRRRRVQFETEGEIGLVAQGKKKIVWKALVTSSLYM